MQESCGNCRYWQAGTETDGVCRRYPPQVVHLSEDDLVLDVWAGTSIDGWCGEYRAETKPLEG